MNCIVSYDKFASSKSGGARKSLLTLLDGIAKSIHISVDVYHTPPVDDLPETDYQYQIYSKRVRNIPKLTWANQTLTRFQWGRYLKQQLTKDYDLLITQNKLAPISIKVANEFNIPSLFFIRSLVLTGYEKYNPNLSHWKNIVTTDIGGKVQYPFLVKNFNDYKRAVQTATYPIANSEFTATKLRSMFRVQPTVIYPPIIKDEYFVEYNATGYFTMVNPRAEYKGADIFLDIAERLSEEEFLLAGPISSQNIQQRASLLPNVTHWEWCDDMREVYAETKLVIVPSRFEEPFGRVAAEAMVSGIPCVVSSRGGLPEVVGKTGEIVQDIESPRAWIRAINAAIRKHDPSAQMNRAEEFSAEKQSRKLIELINKCN